MGVAPEAGGHYLLGDIARRTGPAWTGLAASDLHDDVGAGRTARTIAATLDYWDDPVDVYRVALNGHERLTAKVSGGWQGANVDLVLWRPNTTRVDDARAMNLRAAQSVSPGAAQRLTFTAPGRGWYYVEVKAASAGFGPYSLVLSKTTPKK